MTNQRTPVTTTRWLVARYWWRTAFAALFPIAAMGLTTSSPGQHFSAPTTRSDAAFRPVVPSLEAGPKTSFRRSPAPQVAAPPAYQPRHERYSREEGRVVSDGYVSTPKTTWVQAPGLSGTTTSSRRTQRANKSSSSEVRMAQFVDVTEGSTRPAVPVEEVGRNGRRSISAAQIDPGQPSDLNHGRTEADPIPMYESSGEINLDNNTVLPDGQPDFEGAYSDDEGYYQPGQEDDCDPSYGQERCGCPSSDFMGRSCGNRPYVGGSCCGDVGCSGMPSCACGHCSNGGGWGYGLPFLSLQNLTVYGGVHGFRNALSLGHSGSFGFHEGVNYGAPMPLLGRLGVGMQVGFRTLHSNLSGSDFTDQQHNQGFLTAGLFRRSSYGLQGGAVADVMRDVWYDKLSLTQLRGETSWKFRGNMEVGFLFAASSDTDTTEAPSSLSVSRTHVWTSSDVRAIFVRGHFPWIRGAEGRLITGWTEDSDGLIGAEMLVPISDRISLQPTFSYLIPDEPTNSGGTENEAWNLGISLVWHVGGNARGSGTVSRYRPLFNVADNGSHIVDQR